MTVEGPKRPTAGMKEGWENLSFFGELLPPSFPFVERRKPLSPEEMQKEVSGLIQNPEHLAYLLGTESWLPGGVFPSEWDRIFPGMSFEKYLAYRKEISDSRRRWIDEEVFQKSALFQEAAGLIDRLFLQDPKDREKMVKTAGTLSAGISVAGSIRAGSETVSNVLDAGEVFSLMESALDVFRIPKPKTADLLQRFGAKDDEELYQRTEGIIKAIFNKKSQAGESVIAALKFMRGLHSGIDPDGEKPIEGTRNTGELKINHEIRTVLRVLKEVKSWEKTYSKLTENPFSQGGAADGCPFSGLAKEENLGLLSVFFISLILHDALEDYGDSRFIIKSTYCSLILHDRDKDKTTVLAFSHKDYPDFILHLLSSYTKMQYDPDLVTDSEETELQVRRLVEHFLKPPSSMRKLNIINWMITTGKCADREDNLCARWGYLFDKFAEKIFDTATCYRIPSLHTWGLTYGIGLPLIARARIHAQPMAAGTAFLMLLGATYDDLFSWVIEDEKHKELLARLGEKEEGSLLVPGVSDAAIFTNKGEYIPLHRF